jgi:hypothetical protein
MMEAFRTGDQQFRRACLEFWHTYFGAMKGMHDRRGRPVQAPIKGRNEGTTSSEHIAIFERFWRAQLAMALKVDPASVGHRRFPFREYRSKSFDVCWPLDGQPKILISIKSMQNAYRNFTNRIEEALGDSAVLRLYKLPAVFGFFFFMLDGKVARGIADQGKQAEGDASGRGRGVAPYLDLIEEGGDFFQLTHLDEHRKKAIKAQKTKGKQNVITLAERSLMDLAAEAPTLEADIHYDAIAFVPATVKRLKARPKAVSDWALEFSTVDQRLDFRPFVSRLLETAAFRGLI